jgi:hypothetical protein
VRLCGDTAELGALLDSARGYVEERGYWGYVAASEHRYEGRLLVRDDPCSPVDPIAAFGGSKFVTSRTTHEALFKAWGVFGWPDKRFNRLLEEAVHPRTRQGASQASLVALAEGPLGRDGMGLRVVDHESGFPVYGVRPLGAGVAGKAKNLIFASDGPKPVLGMVDAVNNDLVTLDNEETCLVYDDQIDDAAGLPWDTLVSWWVRTRGTSEDPGRALATRLGASLHPTYEVPFFETYFRVFRHRLGARFPALIPQVYVHYDPRWRGARGSKPSFEVERMDFLLFLPNGVRVVVELDGIQHYSTRQGEKWTPDPSVYARTASGDRALRLRGYEVYRFGGEELVASKVVATVSAFFESLFAKHRIAAP